MGSYLSNLFSGKQELFQHDDKIVCVKRVVKGDEYLDLIREYNISRKMYVREFYSSCLVNKIMKVSTGEYVVVGFAANSKNKISTVRSQVMRLSSSLEKQVIADTEVRVGLFAEFKSVEDGRMLFVNDLSDWAYIFAIRLMELDGDQLTVAGQLKTKMLLGTTARNVVLMGRWTDIFPLQSIVLPGEILIIVQKGDKLDILVTYDCKNIVYNAYDHLVALLVSVGFAVNGRIKILKNDVVDGKNHFLCALLLERKIVVFSHDGQIFTCVDVLKGYGGLVKYRSPIRDCCYDKITGRIVTATECAEDLLFVEVWNRRVPAHLSGPPQSWDCAGPGTSCPRAHTRYRL